MGGGEKIIVRKAGLADDLDELLARLCGQGVVGQATCTGGEAAVWIG